MLTNKNEIAARALCLVGVDTAARRQLRDQLAIFMFHGIEPEPLTPSCWHVLDTEMLSRQLEFLRKHFALLSLEEALERLAAGKLPPRAAALTFDDGTRNLATHAAPILNAYAAPAAVFVTTGPMGTRDTLWADRLWLAFARTSVVMVEITSLGLGSLPLGTDSERGSAYQTVVHRLKELPDAHRIIEFNSILVQLGQADNEDPGPFQLLSWDEARKLTRDSAVTLYPHSVTHPILSQCSDEKLRYEIDESCAALERETGIAPTGFAYPNGRRQDFDDRAIAALRDRGVRWSLSTVEGFADRNSDPYALPRIGIGSDLTFARFRLLASGGESSPKAQLSKLAGSSRKP
jgi:peptidoglycan/xylan/chitin deacetylase (PgdA/CDA1 family)